MSGPAHLTRLRSEIEGGHALAIVGAGVSIGATANAQAASWTGLLQHGVRHCESLGAPQGWADIVRAEIALGDLDSLLSAAEKISRKLAAPGGEYHRWLRESVGALKVADRGVLEALRDLNIPLATTNYDGLLEEATGLKPVTWRDGHRVERLLRGDEQGILHLHGYWDEPDSVILGIRNYEEVRQNAHVQAVLRALRSLRTLIFIGCGEGLGDPNFGAFLTWTREVFNGTEYPHYRLCLEGEVSALRAVHPDGEPIVLVSYGEKHADLAPFLRTLGSARPRPEPQPEPVHSTPRLPPLPRCFGRKDEVEALVSTLCAEPPQPVPVLGPGGIGKSTVTLAALHDRRVVDRFGSRRWFVRCDGATSRDALIGEIAAGIGVEPGGQLDERVYRELEREKGVLVLDNTETPWWGDQERIEELLAQLGGLAGLALVVSIRGEQRPWGVTWTDPIRLGPLPLPAARDAFVAATDKKFRNDPLLDRVLESVDRLPLAISLLASQAEGDADLTTLWKRWQDERIELLRRGDGKSRLTSLAVSLELSIKSPRVSGSARRLLSLLGILPDGMANEDLPVLLPEHSEAASSDLRKTGLAFSQGARLRVLATVREHAALRHPPAPDDLEKARHHYLRLAEMAGQVGKENGAEALQRVGSDTGNLEAMILKTLDGAKPVEARKAALGMSRLFSFTGLGAPTSVEKTLDAARKIANESLEADCLRWLGDIALYRSDHDHARARYQEALSLYQRVKDVLGEANCIWGLGDIALERSDHDNARARFQEALPLYQSVGDVPGEADCIQGLGDIALQRSEHDEARARYQEALPLFQRVGDVLGEANCIKSLGDIALDRSDHDYARARYQEALPLYQRVGDVLGEANCIKSLGDIALDRSEPGTARGLFEEALKLYSRIQEPYSIGWTYVRLARLSDGSAERQSHIAAAREAWTRIKRPDLVARLDQEFGSAPAPDPAPGGGEGR
jgi:tetratricopeptide (TPR) repeat protein